MSEPHLFVVFGATGDLTARKLLPALHRVVGRSRETVILGAARADLDDAAFRDRARRALTEAGRGDASRWCDDRVYYQRVPSRGGLDGLAARMADLEARHGLPGNRILYMALPPAAFPTTIERLGGAGLHRSPGWTRLVIEKPFGHDLETGRALNDDVHVYFEESQVYRIDHYLGKETVRNLLVFRFGNPLFEGAWNRDRIERIEITVAESLDVGSRGAYYDGSGAVRDMLQSHLLQILCLVAMEAPTSMAADDVRDEKAKVLRAVTAIDPESVAFGQYRAAPDGSTPAYREHFGVAAESTTPTFAAVRLLIDNWRWQGVPFYLRTGKAMAERITEVVVTFRPPPVCLFHGEPDQCLAHGDVLRLNLQPDEGFILEIEVKEPGDDRGVRTIPLRFRYEEQFGEIPDAYEALLGDVMEGDQTLFVRSDWVEESWRLFTPILAADLPVEPYPAGSWGPAGAARLLAPGAARWATGEGLRLPRSHGR